MAIPRIRACAICVHGSELLTIALRDPVSGQVFRSVPGGEVETGESAAAAASRETLEETGYRVVADAGSERISRYDFVWAGETYDCQTSWFICELTSTEAIPVLDEDYVLEAAWIPLNVLESRLVEHQHIREVILDMVSPYRT